jgi:hypothetical protein
MPPDRSADRAVLKPMYVWRKAPLTTNSAQLKSARVEQSVMMFESPPSDPEPLSNRIPGDDVMPPPLSTAVACLFARRAAIAAKDLQWRYEVGRLAHKLRYDASRDFMPNVAHALNMTPNTLRAYARVAEAVASSEFDEHVALRDRFGMPMTWSHLEEIAKCRNARGRRKYAHQAISEKLSVRALATLVRVSTPDGGPIDIAGSATD